MTKQNSRLTPVDIARLTGRQLYEVLRAIDKMGLKCVQRYGGRRVFSARQVKEIIATLAEKK